jgi:hypothetical protein
MNSGQSVSATQAGPPGETTHWTAAAMAKVQGISVSSVQCIWRRHGLQPHRTRLFELSNDPQFADKLRDIVGLYVDPPAHAVVLSIDERSQIQALELTKRRLKRGVFRSIVELQAAIKPLLAETNADHRPFRWTKCPDKTIAAVKKEGTKCWILSTSNGRRPRARASPTTPVSNDVSQTPTVLGRRWPQKLVHYRTRRGALPRIDD